mmetsp:Transcript_96396/g.152452  ORF Transcript_96396/g.152452 Transcript_96396/m.152452 type:complete len:174 (+) Transcript_96396:46-567(+)
MREPMILQSQSNWEGTECALRTNFKTVPNCITFTINNRCEALGQKKMAGRSKEPTTAFAFVFVHLAACAQITMEGLAGTLVFMTAITTAYGCKVTTSPAPVVGSTRHSSSRIPCFDERVTEKGSTIYAVAPAMKSVAFNLTVIGCISLFTSRSFFAPSFAREGAKPRENTEFP